ncbi:MAG: hypothetical protein R2726_06775 [Acidimicrobiales bacterium]
MTTMTMTFCPGTDRAATSDGYKQLCTCANRLPLPAPQAPVFRRTLGALVEIVRDIADDHGQAVDVEIVAPPFDRIGIWMGVRVHPDGAVDARMSPWPLSSDPRCPTVERGAVGAHLLRHGWGFPRHLSSVDLRAGGGAVTQTFGADISGGRVAYHLIIAHTALFPVPARTAWEARGYLLDEAGDPDRCLTWAGDPDRRTP